MKNKPKIAMYWATSCGGCEISLANLNEKLIDVDANFDLVFCPCLMDTKKKDVEEMPDENIDITFFNGAIRTEENEEMAKLIRRKTKVLISYGSCACNGSIPALSNFFSAEEHFKTVYGKGPSLDNKDNIIPLEHVKMPEGELRLPKFYDGVKTLSQTVSVDYFIPGCPPETKQLWNVVELVLSGAALPPLKSVIGAGNSTVCDECKRKRHEDKKISRLYRNYEIIPDAENCLMEQGLICMGIATRSGCEALCPVVNMPCIGCYGPPAEVSDVGAKMASAIGSLLDISVLKGLEEKDITKKTDSVLDSFPDYGGTFYKFCLADSLIRHRANKKDGGLK